MVRDVVLHHAAPEVVPIVLGGPQARQGVDGINGLHLLEKAADEGWAPQLDDGRDGVVVAAAAAQVIGAHHGRPPDVAEDAVDAAEGDAVVDVGQAVPEALDGQRGGVRVEVADEEQAVAILILAIIYPPLK